MNCTVMAKFKLVNERESMGEVIAMFQYPG